MNRLANIERVNNVIRVGQDSKDVLHSHTVHLPGSWGASRSAGYVTPPGCCGSTLWPSDAPGTPPTKSYPGGVLIKWAFQMSKILNLFLPLIILTFTSVWILFEDMSRHVYILPAFIFSFLFFYSFSHFTEAIGLKPLTVEMDDVKAPQK